MKSLTACDKVRLKYDVCQPGADVGGSVRVSMEKGIDEREWTDSVEISMVIYQKALLLPAVHPARQLFLNWVPSSALTNLFAIFIPLSCVDRHMFVAPSCFQKF